MKFSSNLKTKPAVVWCVLLLAIATLAPAPSLAQDTPSDEFVLRVGQDQRRLDGFVRGLNAARGSFAFDATSVSYPSGRPNPLDTPRSVVVTTSPSTYFHVRGDSNGDVELDDIHAGDSAVIVATFSTTEQKWVAAEVAVWTKQEKGRYILEGKKPPFPAPPGLVASWKWENSSADTSGKYMGSQQNGAAFAPGFVGKALRFDGVDDRFTVADSPALALTHSLSIEGWLFVTPPMPQAFGMIMTRAAWRGKVPYDFYIKRDGSISFRIQSDKKATFVNTPIPGRQWVHVAATLDDATGVMRLYINGSLASEAQTEVRPRDITGEEGAALGIGNYPYVSGARATCTFCGLIDELSLYNRALTPTEIQGIYQARTAGKAIPPPPVPVPAL